MHIYTKNFRIIIISLFKYGDLQLWYFMVKYCPNCGSQLNLESAQFCNNCGTKIIPAEYNREKIESAGKPLTVEFILGLIGGIIGFFAGIAAILFGSLAAAFSVNNASNVIGLGFGAVIFSIIGIVGAAFVKSKTKIAGYLMIISAIGGLICISAFYILSFILLIIGGIMAVRYKE